MFPDVDTRDDAAVAARIKAMLGEIQPDWDTTLFDQVFAEVKHCFTGEHPDYRKLDLHYHDYQHTLQATLCMGRLLRGWFRAGNPAGISWRQAELALVAVLLHDMGYLKLQHDTEGTSAKYTYAHVLRGCAHAATLLPRFGLGWSEIRIVLGAIRCTGPDADVSRLVFDAPADRLVGSFVATSDYLGQLAAADYPDELEILFNEFMESDDFLGVPPEKRFFKSAEDLIARTPYFWQNVVLPKLKNDFQGAYQYLADPYPDGPNPYLDAIERNIALIKARAAATAPATAGP